MQPDRGALSLWQHDARHPGHHLCSTGRPPKTTTSAGPRQPRPRPQARSFRRNPQCAVCPCVLSSQQPATGAPHNQPGRVGRAEGGAPHTWCRGVHGSELWRVGSPPVDRQVGLCPVGHAVPTVLVLEPALAGRVVPCQPREPGRRFGGSEQGAALGAQAAASA